MISPAVPASPPQTAEDGVSHRQAWRAALLALGLGIAGWVLIFAPEIAAAVRTWDASTAYNHCWLVLPIAGWLGWVRRERLAMHLPAPAPALALLALPLGLGWLLAERLGIMEGRQLAAITLLILLVAIVLGWRLARAMAAPLLYLYFLVPFGAFAVPTLQHVTSRLIDFGLGLTSIPHYVDDLIIEIPAGSFYVAEACAGLRFLIAALAFGALYALTMFRSPWRRLIVMALAVVVPIIANGIRALGIVVLGHFLGSAEAAAADHVIYGWGFFSAVILLLILAGMPFREDAGPMPLGPLPPAQHPASAGRLAFGAGLGLALLASGPVVARVLDRAAGGPETLAPAAFPLPAGCSAEAPGVLRCAGATVQVTLLRFPPQGTWAAVAAARRQLAGGGGDDDATFTVSEPGQVAWQGRQFPGTALAVAAWLNGRPAGDGLGSRLAQARNSLGAGAGQPVVAAVAVRGEPGSSGAQERVLLQALLQAQGAGLVPQARGLSRGR